MNTKNAILVLMLILIISSIFYYFWKYEYFSKLGNLNIEFFSNKKEEIYDYYLDKSIILKLMNQN
jgi:hypothetical protein